MPPSVSLAMASAAAPSGRTSTSAARKRLEQRRQRRPGDDADADIDDPRAAALVEARQHAPALAAQHEVDPPALARCAEQRGSKAGAVHAALLQRALDQARLPGAVNVVPPVLQGAAAAHAEMRAGRLLAMARRREHLDQLGGDALAALVDRFGLDHFARQGEGHEVALAVLLGDAVASRAHLEDVERQRHGSYPSQLLAGRSSPTSRPTTFLTGGCSSSSRRSAGSTPR